MFLQRSAVLALRRAAAAAAPLPKRTFVSSLVRRSENTISKPEEKSVGKFKTFHEIKSEADLIGPGAAPGTVPTDIEQATGLERLEILGKMAGVDIFDLKPLDASRLGTMADPIVIPSFGDERYLGCTGFPADSHNTIWLTVSKDRPVERCPECGSVYKMDYLGPTEDAHAHDHDHHDEHHSVHVDPPTMADFVRPEYRY